MQKIAIVGSGLSSISAAKILISRGVKPTIIDCGNTIDEEKVRLVERMSHLEPSDWSREDINLLTNNPTIHNKKIFPKKLAFGSDFFYGKADQYEAIKFEGAIPPFSYAKGGLSSGWGAAVLSPDEADLTLWPIGNKELNPFFKMVLADVPYSASNDNLSTVFPLFSNNAEPLDLTSGNKEVLEDLNKYVYSNNQKTILVGQSRLLVRVSKDSTGNGCKYCGNCMSGCVYDYIYKASSELDRLILSNKVDYRPNTLVQKVSEDSANAYIEVKDTLTEEISSLIFNKVLLGAGAVNSTRIVLRSKGLYNMPVRLLSTVTFVAPVFRLKKMKVDWPKTNTQPGIFLELKDDNFSKNWVHVQVSTPNEIVLDKLGVDFNKKSIMQWLKKKLLAHLLIVHGSIHSNNSPGYKIILRKTDDDGIDELYSKREQKKDTYGNIKRALFKLNNIFRKINCFVIIPLAQNSIKSGGYHVGGSLPMRENPIEDTETNLLGNPKDWNNIHVIDSSVFPSLPATTIGLLSMANASRIASKMDIN